MTLSLVLRDGLVMRVRGGRGTSTLRMQDPGQLAPGVMCSGPVLCPCSFLPRGNTLTRLHVTGSTVPAGGQPARSCAVEQTRHHEQQSHAKSTDMRAVRFRRHWKCQKMET